MKFHQLLFILFINLSYSQESDYVTFNKLTESKLLNRELRVSILEHIDNRVRFIRIYEDNRQWFLEEYISRGKDEHMHFIEFDETDDSEKIDSIKVINTYKSKSIKLKSNFFRKWKELINTKILNLPKFDSIKYKFLEEEVDIDIDNKKLIYFAPMFILDGVTYKIEIKNDHKFNRIVYDNPKSYYSLYPDIDELIYFNNFLKKLDEIRHNN